MPDVLNIEPALVGRDMATGHEASRAATTAGAGGRRISASSFKLLTAKLKGAKTGPAGMADTAIPDLTVLPSGPASSPGIDEVTADTGGSYHDVAAHPDTAADPGAADAAPRPPDSFADLPAFRPLTGFDPLPLETSATAANGVPAAQETPPEIAAGELADGDLASPLDFKLPEFKPVEGPLQPAALADSADHQPDLDESQPVEPVKSGFSAETESPEVDLPPLLETSAELELATDVHHVEALIDAGIETVADSEASPDVEVPAKSQVLVVPSAPIEAEAVSDFEPELPDVESAHLMPATVAPQEHIGDLTAALVDDAVISQSESGHHTGTSPAEAVQPDLKIEVMPADGVKPPPLSTGEVKAASSELAGRVVDAMIKTISAAIYAKPTSAERAAFLSEVAILMQEAAQAGDTATHSHVEPVARAAGPVVSISPVVHAPAAAHARPEIPVTEAIAERIGPAPLLKTGTVETEPDPFAQSALPARLTEPKPAETVNADEESGDLALKLLDMMSGGTSSLPHERTLAADTLLRILPRIPVKQLLSVVERVAIMETPPALLVAKLIRDTRPEVVGPLLERCSHISDQDLMNAAPDGDTNKLRMVARRRVLSTVLSDFLIATGDPGVLLTLIRNPGASLSHEAFFSLAEAATMHHGLLAPLATRADLPPPVAFELFWHVPQELRRFIFSRFLTDSETLNKILRITLTTHGNDGGDALGDGKFPSREAFDSAIDLISGFKLDEAANAFGEIGGISRDTAMRILSDREGEPLTVLFKALGCSRARFEEVVSKLKLGDAGILRPDRHADELQAIFDGLSFNKARILLTYWDWYIRKAGPYAPHN